MLLSKVNRHRLSGGQNSMKILPNAVRSPPIPSPATNQKTHIIARFTENPIRMPAIIPNKIVLRIVKIRPYLSAIYPQVKDPNSYPVINHVPTDPAAVSLNPQSFYTPRISTVHR